MSDLDSYVDERKKRDKGFDEGYEQFKIGEVLRQAREAAGLTQEERPSASIQKNGHIEDRESRRGY